MFRVDYLPDVYRNTLYFQVVKVEHEINNSTWTTNLETVVRFYHKRIRKPVRKTQDVYLSCKFIKNELNITGLNNNLDKLSEIKPYDYDLPGHKFFSFKARNNFIIEPTLEVQSFTNTIGPFSISQPGVINNIVTDTQQTGFFGGTTNILTNIEQLTEPWTSYKDDFKTLIQKILQPNLFPNYEFADEIVFFDPIKAKTDMIKLGPYWDNYSNPVSKRPKGTTLNMNWCIRFFSEFEKDDNGIIMITKGQYFIINQVQFNNFMTWFYNDFQKYLSEQVETVFVKD